MTARDIARSEAVAAMKAEMDYRSDERGTELLGRMLDAIPPGVLVRLAIEQGALVETSRKINMGSEHIGGGKYRNKFATLYRVVEP